MIDYVPFNAPAPALEHVQQWAALINAEAQLAKVPPCALAAIVCRESGGQDIPPQRGSKRAGRGVGLTRISTGVHWTDPGDPTYDGYHLLRPAENLYVCCAHFIAPLLANATRLQAGDPAGFARFGQGQILYYLFAAYNAGWASVTRLYAKDQDPDSGTSDGYAADTFERYMKFVAVSHATVGR